MIRIHGTTGDDAVLAELGERLREARLAKDLTQEQLAAEAGVSRDTVERLERGESVQLRSLIRMLRAAQLLQGLDQLIPAPLASPIDALERRGRRRKRASGSRKDAAQPPQAGRGWRWGDEPDPGEGG